MCGIVGEIGPRRYIADNHATVRRMCDTIIHRGPDEEGYHSVAYLGHVINLGVRRLSIIDREHGQQPISRAGVTVAFNGEIYNHHQLREQLNGLREFRTKSDTEVVLESYSVWATDFVQNLTGMFAIAVWDSRCRQLHLWRDRLGKKPLYYWHDSGRGVFVFASEIKAILAHPLFSKEPNLPALYDYIALQYVPEPETAFAGIHAVLPGQHLTYSLPEQSVGTSHYWILPTKVTDADEDQLLPEIRGRIRNAVESRLESEVPLGVYLSGGIDSAIVTGLARQCVDELHTFTMGFENADYDERADARLTAEHFGTIHHEVICEPADCAAAAERIVEQYDQPFGDCSAIPTLHLAEASKPYFTVALCGDGGDEAWGGYARHWQTQADLKEYMPYLMVWWSGMQAKLWGQDDSPQPRPIRDWLMSLLPTGVNPNDGKLIMDSLTYLPNDIIVKMERATMAHSIEARCPLLDHKVFELAMSIPARHKLGAFSGKVILKEAFRDMLPAGICQRPKRGFSVPINEWFRTEAGRQMIDKTIWSGRCPLLHKQTVREAAANHLMGRWSVGHGLWILLMLDMWYDKHFGASQ